MSAAELEVQAAATTYALQSARAEIEAIDALLVDALARRMRLARTVRAAKQAAGLPVCDPAREAEVVSRVGAAARDAGLPEDEVRAVWWRIMAMMRRGQVD